jgi:deoxyribodipyrimidine photo-lyase
LSGKQRLQQFINEAAHNYEAQRNYPAVDGTSSLSPYLHFGHLSPRQIWWAVQDSGKTGDGITTFLKEVVWREFAYHVLFHFPETPENPLRAEFGDFPWEKDEEMLNRWKKGNTGYPLVDAGMRQLYREGWMHNRVRMVVASLLVKHMLQPWQEGASWFWHTLLDADLASNTLGWQWAGGCGADAAPYFRIFNPITQSEKFDSEGDYIRKYVPELRKLESPHIHAPWEAPPHVLESAGIELGRDYPEPLIEHKAGRERALKAFESIKKS